MWEVRHALDARSPLPAVGAGEPVGAEQREADLAGEGAQAREHWLAEGVAAQEEGATSTRLP